MKVLTEGHRYELANFYADIHECNQILQFIEKTPLPGGVLQTLHDGTTNEEVLRMLIDRMTYLQKKCACRENAIVITKLEESLMWMEKRTADRRGRGVEGRAAP